VIVYRKAPHLRLHRAAAPEPPFWAATTIAPYSARRAAPIAIDYLELRAGFVEKVEALVCEDVAGEIERTTIRQQLAEPAFIEATEFAEVVFRRGEEALWACAAQQCAALLLVSTHGALPREVPEGTVIAVSAWPLELERLGTLSAEARERGLAFGIVVPIIFPVTTDLASLASLADLARQHEARFLASFAVDVDAAARKALAESMATDDETYDQLFHADLEPVIVATERHIAALAAEIGADDFITPPRWERRSNWNGAVLLTLTAARMLAMKHDVETATRLARSARVIAQLEKPIARIAEAASLSIVDPLDDLSVDMLTEWIETGRSAFCDHIGKQWRLRRDAGLQQEPGPTWKLP
jgi:hypothetical protein